MSEENATLILLIPEANGESHSILPHPLKWTTFTKLRICLQDISNTVYNCWTYPNSMPPTLLRICILAAELTSSLKPKDNFLFIWIEERHLGSLWYLKRQDLSFLSTSFFTHLYLTLSPWNFYSQKSLMPYYFSFLHFWHSFLQNSLYFLASLLASSIIVLSFFLFFLLKYLCLVLESHHQ